jgi:magnesium transporter
MTTGFISIPANLLISDVITEVRRRADEAETIDVVYVVSEGERLLGVMSMRDLLMADSHQVVNEVMRRNIISVPPELDQEEAARKLAKYDLNTLPVVDDQGVLLGVITADDILDVLTEEQAEDVQKMGAVAPIPEGYFDASFVKYVQRRAPWLMILFVGSYFTASAMEQYDDVLSAVTQLAFYVPLLISTGGNSGSQSATLVIRGLAVGEIRPRDWWRVLLRELGQGLTLGLLLAVFGVLRVLLAGDGADFAALIAVVVVAIVTAGCVIGGMLPLLLHRLGVDPATSSSPFVATLSDVVGIVVYLGTARWLLLEVLAKSAPGH